MRFWGPVLGARSGAQNWVTNTRFINNPCIWGQPGAQNWDQKRCPKLGTKMVTKCSPPAKKRPTSRRRNCKNHCTKLGPKTIAKTRIKFCAQNDSLTVAGYCNSGLASGSVWRRVGTARNHDCEARFFNISGSCFGHLIFGICHGDARRRYSRRPKKTNLTEIFFFPNFFQQFARPSPKFRKFLEFLKLVCRARHRGFLPEDRAMLQAVRSARSARRARGACEEIFFPIFFSNLRLRPRRFASFCNF